MLEKGSISKWIPLGLLTTAGFTFNTSELMPIGLLSDIASSFHTTEQHTGMLITIYAWIVALLSLPLTLYFSKTDFRKVMLWIVGIFAVSHALSAVSHTYGLLLLSRMGVACAHSIFWSIAPSMAVAVTPGKVQSLALSVMVAGGGVALVAGLPLGRVLGLIAGWRVTFAALGILALIVFIGLKLTLPSLPQNNDQESKTDMLRHILHSPPLLMIYLITAVFVTGHYTGYSYIEPFMAQVTGMSEQSITLSLCLFGVAGLAGSFMMARYFRKYPRQIIMGSCLGLPVVMLLLLPASGLGIVALCILCVLWGLTITVYNIAFQNEIILFSPSHPAVAMSIYSGIFNLGIGLGALVGGITVENSLIGYLGVVGGCIALSAAIFVTLRFVRIVS